MGLRFWQRLFAVWQMSSGDWTEVFKMIALSGELEDIALVYFEKMLAGRTAVSNALDHTMNSMLILYMAPMSSAKSIERMSKEKSPIKTMPEHYQILVYVEERYINWSSMGYKIAAGRRYRSSRTQC